MWATAGVMATPPPAVVGLSPPWHLSAGAGQHFAFSAFATAAPAAYSAGGISPPALASSFQQPAAPAAGLMALEPRWQGDLSEEEFSELARLRVENASLQEELQSIERAAARVEAEVRRGAAENDRLLEDILVSSAPGTVANPTLASPTAPQAGAAPRELSRSPSEQATRQSTMSESDLLVEGLAASLRAEMQSLWADGREVRALAARRETELRMQLARSTQEEHTEARAARRVRDAAHRKVAAVREELDAVISEVATAKSEQAAAKASFSSSVAKPMPGTIVRARYGHPLGEEVYDISEAVPSRAEVREREYEEAVEDLAERYRGSRCGSAATLN